MYSSATNRSAGNLPPSVYWLSRMYMPPRGGYLGEEGGGARVFLGGACVCGWGGGVWGWWWRVLGGGGADGRVCFDMEYACVRGSNVHV
jgi:hypothetical protein